MKRIFKFFLLPLLMVPVLYVGAFYFLQEKLIFKAVPLSQEYAYDYEVPFEEVFLVPEEGVRLNALHFKAESPKGMVVYYHGQGGNLSKKWDEVSRIFTRAGYDFFIMDYRTFGKSKGLLSEKALFKDASFVYEHCRKYFSEDKLIVYGCSLGTGIASYIGAHYEPKKVILESPYSSMIDLATYTASYLPKFSIPMILKYPLRSDEWVKKFTSPLLIFHGTEDKTIPHHMGEALFKSAEGIKSAEMISVEEIGHCEIAAHPKTLEHLENHL